MINIQHITPIGDGSNHLAPVGAAVIHRNNGLTVVRCDSPDQTNNSVKLSSQFRLGDSVEIYRVDPGPAQQLFIFDQGNVDAYVINAFAGILLRKITATQWGYIRP